MKSRTAPFKGFSRGLPIVGEPRQKEEQSRPLLPAGLYRYLVVVEVQREGEPPFKENFIHEMSRPMCESADIAQFQERAAASLTLEGGSAPRVTISNIVKLLFLDQEIVDKIEARKKAEADLLEAYLKDEHAEGMGHASEYAFHDIPQDRRELIRLAAAEIRAEREREAKERADGMPACADCDRPVTIAEAESGGGRCPDCAAANDCIPADAVPCPPCGECGQAGEPIADCRVSADPTALSWAGWVCQNRDCSRYHAGMFPAEAYSMTNAEILARGGTVPEAAV